LLYLSLSVLSSSLLLFLPIEKNADDFTIRELLKIRQKGLNEDAVTQYERCGPNAAYAKIGV
jgi:hypothetical protein